MLVGGLYIYHQYVEFYCSQAMKFFCKMWAAQFSNVQEIDRDKVDDGEESLATRSFCFVASEMTD